MRDLVSVIVPCFNYARYLDQCIDSVIRQSHQRWECIIVDDGSTDETADVCTRLAKMDSRVTFVRQNNRGLGAARNAGVRQANGEFVQLLDADDLLEPEKLKVQVAFLGAHPDTDVVLGEGAFFDDGFPRDIYPRTPDGIVAMTRRVLGEGTPILAALVEGNVGVVHAALVRSSVFQSVGLFDEILRAHEDWDFWFRCARKGHRFAYLSVEGDRALVRQHGSNMSRAKELMLRTAITVRERVHAELPNHLRAKNGERICDLKSALAIELVGAGKAREGWTLYGEALRSAHRKSKALLRPLLLVPGVGKAARLSRRVLSSFFPV
jgi:glycosyltransferase involved in cell wall biosynthesis